jgi:hypothetical protein
MSLPLAAISSFGPSPSSDPGSAPIGVARQDDLGAAGAELGRVGGHRVEHEVFHPGVDARLEGSDDIVGCAEQIDLQKVRTRALGPIKVA